MQKFYWTLRLLLVSILTISAVACTSGGSDDGGNDNDNGTPDTPTNSANFTTDCGVVVNAELKNPVANSEGQVANVQITGPNQAIVNVAGSPFLVKFHGMRNISDFRRSLAVSTLEQLATGPAIYFEAEDECTDTVAGGGTAFVGQLFTSNGVSYNEQLFKEGLGSTDTSDTCGGPQLVNCYRALENSGEQIGGVISNFLWKPVAERDGRLVVLLNPGGATITANGVTLADSGPSNGRGTTARGNQPGCAYGSNVRLRVTDRSGRVLLFPNGARTYVIPNGCDRVEF